MSTGEPGTAVHFEAAPPPGAGWRAVLERIARGLLLAVLLSGLGAVVLVRAADHRSAADLTADLRSGQVAEIVHDGLSTVRWTGDRLHWHQADLGANPGRGPGPWLREQVAASGHPAAVSEIVTDSLGEWPVGAPWRPLRLATMAAFLLTLGWMLTRRRHRYAGRWAWTWLIVFGTLGAPAYLLLEPGPIWRRTGAGPLRSRRPLSGLQGFGLALATNFGLASIWLLVMLIR